MSLIKDHIVKLLHCVLPESDGLSGQDIAQLIQKARQASHGDFAFPCFTTAREAGISPDQLAQHLADKIQHYLADSQVISKVEAVGGYLNFHLNRCATMDAVLNKVVADPDSFGSSQVGKGKTVVIDYSAPNLGKPMHVGHIRSTIIGDSLIRLLQFIGYKTHGINYLGDIGLHIGKVIAAYELWGNSSKLRDDPITEMLDLYVRFNKAEEENPTLVDMAKKTLEKLEAGSTHEVAIWNLIKELSLEAFNRVYALLDVKFDEVSGQSYFTEAGKRVVQRALELNVAHYEKVVETKISMDAEESEEELGLGGVVVQLEPYGLTNKAILRGDGTAIYATQDLGVAVERYKRFEPDQILYIVANEQSLYFQQIFKTLDLLGYEWAKHCHHISFGLIHLAGERMSTREGRVVFLEDVLLEAIRRARELTVKKMEESVTTPDIDLDQLARDIGVGAIKYSILSIDNNRDIYFSWESALNFNSNSAPYIQYTHARASRVLERAGRVPDNLHCEHDVSEVEFNLAKQLAEFENTVLDAASKYNPSIIARYLDSLANSFGVFYDRHRIIGSSEEGTRLALTFAVQKVLKSGLGLLGIAAPERM
jgi:arginyl-tRNA synthetase